MKSDLRELIWQIDAGESPQLNHVEDPDLLRGLRGLFGALNLKRSKVRLPGFRSFFTCEIKD